MLPVWINEPGYLRSSYLRRNRWVPSVSYLGYWYLNSVVTGLSWYPTSFTPQSWPLLRKTKLCSEITDIRFLRGRKVKRCLPHCGQTNAAIDRPYLDISRHQVYCLNFTRSHSTIWKLTTWGMNLSSRLPHHIDLDAQQFLTERRCKANDQTMIWSNEIHTWGESTIGYRGGWTDIAHSYRR